MRQSVFFFFFFFVGGGVYVFFFFKMMSSNILLANPIRSPGQNVPTSRKVQMDPEGSQTYECTKKNRLIRAYKNPGPNPTYINLRKKNKTKTKKK